MIPEKKLQSLLLGDAPTAALVATRVRMDLAEEADAMPYVVFVRDETGAMHTLCDVIDNPDVQFEVHCWAASRMGAEALASAAKAAMQAAGMSVVAHEAAFSREVDAHCAVLKVVFD
jgi:hypothetical protein